MNMRWTRETTNQLDFIEMFSIGMRILMIFKQAPTILKYTYYGTSALG